MDECESEYDGVLDTKSLCTCVYLLDDQDLLQLLLQRCVFDLLMVRECLPLRILDLDRAEQQEEEYEHEGVQYDCDSYEGEYDVYEQDLEQEMELE
ncbi:MAG: hypothetical protein EZS28_015547 [Streblomastix strix]|uniref:Uncharacterized protein n=1 Tax=Streblomastix strix TaxID=222440 RepID=A0A5J4W2Z2_9EUKA|nr:MAG: hypothetical protein EZS28_015547 [Streblomastix strix]